MNEAAQTVVRKISQTESFWNPDANSTIAAQTDWAFNLVNYINLVFFALIIGVMVYCVVKFKRKSDDEPTSPLEHHTGLEIFWTTIPLAIVMGLFWVGFRGYVNLSVAPRDAYQINATAQKWAWAFGYPSGFTKLGELRVPKGRPVKILMSSKDVIHSLYIPEFRVKQDAVPGLYTSLWFEATKAGETTLECTEYCGKDHSAMLATVIVMEPADFDKWVDNGGEEGPPMAPEKKGEKLFTSAGCVACHNLTGAAGGLGPTFKGAFGREEELTTGDKVTVDETYLRESILNPTAKVVKGFNPVMPVFKGVLSDKDVDALIAWIKTVK